LIGTTTKKLLLMRHAKSDWNDTGLSDVDRPLNARGRSAAPTMGKWLLANDMLPDEIVCSTAVRTRQTLELLIECWSQERKDRQQEDSRRNKPEIVFMDDLYLAPALRILTIASKHTSKSCVMVLGHNPGMEEVASYLGQSPVHMPTAAIAILESTGRNWPEDWLQASSWNWRGLVKPRDLGSQTI
jgi:phosphohistidine phosphatase